MVMPNPSLARLVLSAAAAALMLLAPSAPAAACSPPLTCAESYCLGATSLLDAVLLDLDDPVADDGLVDATLRLDAIYGEAGDLGGTVVLTVPEYQFYDGNLGQRHVVYADVFTESTGTTTTVVSAARADDSFLTGCLGQDGGASLDLAAAAAVLLSATCAATLDREPPPDTAQPRCLAPTGCSAAGTDGALGLLLVGGTALVTRRRRRRAPLPG